MSNDYTIRQQRRIKILIVFLFCAAAFTAAAQNVWSSTYIGGKPTMLFSSIAYDAESFKVIGVVSGQPNNLSKGFVLAVDTAGEITLLKVFEDSFNVRNGLFWNTLIQNDKNDFCFIGFAFDSLPSLSFYVSSNNLDSIKTHKYYTPNTSAFQGYSILQYQTASYFLTGVRTNELTNNADIVLLRIDLLGNRIWEKYYNQQKYDFAKSIIQLANGNLMLGAVRNDVNQTNEKSNTWLLEVDTGGNIVRQWFDPSDSTYVAEGLRQTQDGGFIYGAQKKAEQTINDVYKTATIVKLDSNFNKQWVFNGGSISSYTSVSDIEELPDGSIIACGNKPFYETDSNTVSGWIIKLTANGSVVWERVYRGINQTQTLNLLSDIDILPDGGLIAVGQCQKSGATPPQVGWFLKLDSNGCEVENCLVGIDERNEKREMRQLHIQPNPATNYVEVVLPDDMQSAMIVMYDVAGKEVKQFQVSSLKFEVDVSDLGKGLYVVVAEKEGKFARVKLMID